MDEPSVDSVGGVSTIGNSAGVAAGAGATTTGAGAAFFTVFLGAALAGAAVAFVAGVFLARGAGLCPGLAVVSVPLPQGLVAL